jgi:hypothetical protein
MSDEIKRQFSNLALSMEPENLYCDGEISAAQAKKKLSRIRREWKALERKAGRSVSLDEAWDWILPL